MGPRVCVRRYRTICVINTIFSIITSKNYDSNYLIYFIAFLVKTSCRRVIDFRLRSNFQPTYRSFYRLVNYRRYKSIFFSPGVCGSGAASVLSEKQKRRDLVVGPRDTNPPLITPEQQNNTEVVAQVGGTATIKCYTHFLGDEMVRNNIC